MQTAWGVDGPLAEKMKQDLFNRLMASPEKNGPEKQKILTTLMPVIDPIVKEIEYSFDIYFHQSGNEEKRPEKIILTGGGSFLPYFTDHLAERFKLKCYLGDPWGRVVYQEGLKPVLRNLGPRLSVAIGLALRKIV